MKTSSIIQFVILLMAITMAGCNSGSNIKVDEDYSDRGIKERILRPESQIALAQKDTYSDFQKFVKEAYTKIDRNEINISEMKIKSTQVNHKSSIINQEKVDDLKKSNDSYKAELDKYVLNGNGNWRTFKSEFNLCMDELTIAFNDVSSKEQ